MFHHLGTGTFHDAKRKKLSSELIMTMTITIDDDRLDDVYCSQALGMCMGGAPAGPAGQLPKSFSQLPD